MLNDWGYYRYGKTYVLPSRTNDNNWKKYLSAMQPFFGTFSGKTYDPYTMGEVKTSNIIKSMYKNVGSPDDLYSKDFVYYWNIKDGTDYKSPFEFFRLTLLKFLVDNDKDEILRIVVSCSLFYKNILQYFAWPDGGWDESLNPTMEIGGKFKQAHQMETYCAYMNAMTESQIKQTRLYYENNVNCPVDIEVYDNATNELVGKITNNVIDENVAAKENAIVMDVEGDSKSFWLPSNGDYRVILTGNDDGTMDYTVSSIDSDTGETERVNFFDVEIENGVSMEGEIACDDFVLDEYTLTHEEDGAIEPTEIIDDVHMQSVTINTSAEGNGIADNSFKVTRGDYVTISAVVTDGGYFRGWYENGKLISTDINYSFVAKENKNFVAKFVDFGIRTPSTTTINYGDSIWLHAEISGELPADARIIWTPSNNNFEIVEVSADGLSCKITPKSNGTTTFTVSVVDANEKVISTDTQDMNAKAGFFDKIIAFFKKIFGASKTILEFRNNSNEL